MVCYFGMVFGYEYIFFFIGYRRYSYKDYFRKLVLGNECNSFIIVCYKYFNFFNFIKN